MRKNVSALNLFPNLQLRSTSIANMPPTTAVARRPEEPELDPPIPSDGDSDDVLLASAYRIPWKEDIAHELTKDSKYLQGTDHSPRRFGSNPPVNKASTRRRAAGGGGDHNFDLGDEENACDYGTWFERERLIRSFRTLYPWIFTIGLGLIVALNGAYITHNADFFGDLRFGICAWGARPVLADRKRCCGGIENYDEERDKCVLPTQVVAEAASSLDGARQQWYAWEAVFGQESRRAALGGWLVAMLVYVLSSVMLTAVCCFIVFEFAPQAKGSGGVSCCARGGRWTHKNYPRDEEDCFCFGVRGQLDSRKPPRVANVVGLEKPFSFAAAPDYRGRVECFFSPASRRKAI